MDTSMGVKRSASVDSDDFPSTLSCYEVVKALQASYHFREVSVRAHGIRGP